MRFPALVVLGLALMLTACGGDDGAASDDAASGVPVVYTTFYPTTYIAERLAEGDAQVVCPVPADEDPIFWKPSEAVVQAYQKADLIVVNGAAFEKWVLKTSLPTARVVDTAKSFQDQFLTFEEAVEHSHGPSGAHAHEGVDGHTWLDPVLAKLQATEIATALKRVLPDASPAIDLRLSQLHADLDRLHAGFGAITRTYEGRTILASHPAYNYPARRYGWKVVSLDLDPEAMPDAATFDEIRQILASTPARHILWESAPLPEIAARFRDELRLESVLFSPVELLSEEDRAAGLDYMKIMDANRERMAPVVARESD